MQRYAICSFPCSIYATNGSIQITQTEQGSSSALKELSLNSHGANYNLC